MIKKNILIYILKLSYSYIKISFYYFLYKIFIFIDYFIFFFKSFFLKYFIFLLYIYIFIHFILIFIIIYIIYMYILNKIFIYLNLKDKWILPTIHFIFKLLFFQFFLIKIINFLKKIEKYWNIFFYEYDLKFKLIWKFFKLKFVTVYMYNIIFLLFYIFENFLIFFYDCYFHKKTYYKDIFLGNFVIIIAHLKYKFQIIINLIILIRIYGNKLFKFIIKVFIITEYGKLFFFKFFFKFFFWKIIMIILKLILKIIVIIYKIIKYILIKIILIYYFNKNIKYVNFFLKKKFIKNNFYTKIIKENFFKIKFYDNINNINNNFNNKIYLYNYNNQLSLESLIFFIQKDIKYTIYIYNAYLNSKIDWINFYIFFYFILNRNYKNSIYSFNDVLINDFYFKLCNILYKKYFNSFKNFNVKKNYLNIFWINIKFIIFKKYSFKGIISLYNNNILNYFKYSYFIANTNVYLFKYTLILKQFFYFFNKYVSINMYIYFKKIKFLKLIIKFIMFYKNYKYNYFNINKLFFIINFLYKIRIKHNIFFYFYKFIYIILYFLFIYLILGVFFFLLQIITFFWGGLIFFYPGFFKNFSYFYHGFFSFFLNYCYTFILEILQYIDRSEFIFLFEFDEFFLIRWLLSTIIVDVEFLSIIFTYNNIFYLNEIFNLFIEFIYNLIIYINIIYFLLNNILLLFEINNNSITNDNFFFEIKEIYEYFFNIHKFLLFQKNSNWTYYIYNNNNYDYWINYIYSNSNLDFLIINDNKNFLKAKIHLIDNSILLNNIKIFFNSPDILNYIQIFDSIWSVDKIKGIFFKLLDNIIFNFSILFLYELFEYNIIIFEIIPKNIKRLFFMEYNFIYNDFIDDIFLKDWFYLLLFLYKNITITNINFFFIFLFKLIQLLFINLYFNLYLYLIYVNKYNIFIFFFEFFFFFEDLYYFIIYVYYFFKINFFLFLNYLYIIYDYFITIEIWIPIFWEIFKENLLYNNLFNFKEIFINYNFFFFINIIYFLSIYLNNLLDWLIIFFIFKFFGFFICLPYFINKYLYYLLIKFFFEEILNIFLNLFLIFIAWIIEYFYNFVIIIMHLSDLDFFYFFKKFIYYIYIDLFNFIYIYPIFFFLKLIINLLYSLYLNVNNFIFFIIMFIAKYILYTMYLILKIFLHFFGNIFFFLNLNKLSNFLNFLNLDIIDIKIYLYLIIEYYVYIFNYFIYLIINMVAFIFLDLDFGSMIFFENCCILYLNFINTEIFIIKPLFIEIHINSSMLYYYIVLHFLWVLRIFCKKFEYYSDPLNEKIDILDTELSVEELWQKYKYEIVGDNIKALKLNFAEYCFFYPIKLTVWLSNNLEAELSIRFEKNAAFAQEDLVDLNPYFGLEEDEELHFFQIKYRIIIGYFIIKFFQLKQKLKFSFLKKNWYKLLLISLFVNNNHYLYNDKVFLKNFIFKFKNKVFLKKNYKSIQLLSIPNITYFTDKYIKLRWITVFNIKIMINCKLNKFFKSLRNLEDYFVYQNKNKFQLCNFYKNNNDLISFTTNLEFSKLKNNFNKDNNKLFRNLYKNIINNVDNNNIFNSYLNKNKIYLEEDKLKYLSTDYNQFMPEIILFGYYNKVKDSYNFFYDMFQFPFLPDLMGITYFFSDDLFISMSQNYLNKHDFLNNFWKLNFKLLSNDLCLWSDQDVVPDSYRWNWFFSSGFFIGEPWFFRECYLVHLAPNEFKLSHSFVRLAKLVNSYENSWIEDDDRGSMDENASLLSTFMFDLVRREFEIRLSRDKIRTFDSWDVENDTTVQLEFLKLRYWNYTLLLPNNEWYTFLFHDDLIDMFHANNIHTQLVLLKLIKNNINILIELSTFLFWIILKLENFLEKILLMYNIDTFHKLWNGSSGDMSIECLNYFISNFINDSFQELGTINFMNSFKLHFNKNLNYLNKKNLNLLSQNFSQNFSQNLNQSLNYCFNVCYLKQLKLLNNNKFQLQNNNDYVNKNINYNFYEKKYFYNLKKNQLIFFNKSLYLWYNNKKTLTTLLILNKKKNNFNLFSFKKINDFFNIKYYLYYLKFNINKISIIYNKIKFFFLKKI